MKKSTLGLMLLCATAVPMVGAPMIARAQTQTSITRPLAGKTVINEKHETIGTITDVLVSMQGGESYAVLDVSAYVGQKKQVVVPLNHLNLCGAEPMMAADLHLLQGMPSFGIGR
jgi:sporulation protein YlmC with PRC-barrel domain